MFFLEQFLHQQHYSQDKRRKRCRRASFTVYVCVCVCVCVLVCLFDLAVWRITRSSSCHSISSCPMSLSVSVPPLLLLLPFSIFFAFLMWGVAYMLFPSVLTASSIRVLLSDTCTGAANHEVTVTRNLRAAQIHMLSLSFLLSLSLCLHMHTLMMSCATRGTRNNALEELKGYPMKSEREREREIILQRNDECSIFSWCFDDEDNGHGWHWWNNRCNCFIHLSSLPK